MSLKESILSNHILFEEKYPTNKENQTIRSQALAIFEKKGFPQKQEEDWKYTNLQPLLKEDYKLFSTQSIDIDYNELRKYLIQEADTYKLVFINGVFNSTLSATTHEEADICILSSALHKARYAPVIENYFNRSKNATDSLFSLNTAFAHEGAYIHVPKGVIVSKPVQIIFFTIGENQRMMLQPRNLIVVEGNSEIQIIEKHHSINTSTFNNIVTEIYAEKNAHIDYYKIQNDTPEASLNDYTTINQEKDSQVSIHTFSFGGNITRNNLSFYQNGQNCNSILKGITIIGNNQLIDHHTLVAHNAPNCESHELYKGIFQGKAKGVFNGKVIVDKEAQKINAYQQNNNILLSEEASIDTKPQLEIFADDVKCSHGCTVGQLDDEALFYLQSRGIPLKEAKALMTYAFAADVLESIKIPQIKQMISQIIAQKLNVDFSTVL